MVRVATYRYGCTPTVRTLFRATHHQQYGRCLAAINCVARPLASLLSCEPHENVKTFLVVHSEIAHLRNTAAA